LTSSSLYQTLEQAQHSWVIINQTFRMPLHTYGIGMIRDFYGFYKSIRRNGRGPHPTRQVTYTLMV
jgi:hypothetical protein